MTRLKFMVIISEIFRIYWGHKIVYYFLIYIDHYKNTDIHAYSYFYKDNLKNVI